MKCVERRGGEPVLGAVNSAPLFPLFYEIAAMDGNGKQVLYIAAGMVACG
jgi:hypothetical protein